ncbi:MAG: hypothetical protein RL707_1780, partial [Pseudomonadota bacterium]
MVRTAQQVEQSFFVGLVGGLQCSEAAFKLLLKLGGDKALRQQGIACELVDHPWVLL